jgi:hypothetical protein
LDSEEIAKEGASFNIFLGTKRAFWGSKLQICRPKSLATSTFFKTAQTIIKQNIDGDYPIKKKL